MSLVIEWFYRIFCVDFEYVCVFEIKKFVIWNWLFFLKWKIVEYLIIENLIVIKLNKLRLN